MTFTYKNACQTKSARPTFIPEGNKYDSIYSEGFKFPWRRFSFFLRLYRRRVAWKCLKQNLVFRLGNRWLKFRLWIIDVGSVALNGEVFVNRLLLQLIVCCFWRVLNF